MAKSIFYFFFFFEKFLRYSRVGDKLNFTPHPFYILAHRVHEVCYGIFCEYIYDAKDNVVPYTTRQNIYHNLIYNKAMMKSVIAVENATTGELVTERVVTMNGEEKSLFTIQLNQMVANVGDGSGIGTVSKRVCFYTIDENMLEFIADELEHNGVFPLAQEGGKLYIVESHKPSWTSKSVDENGKPKQQACKVYPKGHPKAGKPILVNGKKVYRTTKFTTDMSIKDVILRESQSASNDVEGDDETI